MRLSPWKALLNLWEIVAKEGIPDCEGVWQNLGQRQHVFVQ